MSAATSVDMSVGIDYQCVNAHFDIWPIGMTIDKPTKERKMMYNLKAIFNKKPLVEESFSIAAFEIEGKSLRISEDGVLVTTNTPTDIMGWQSTITVRTIPSSIQYRFTTTNTKRVDVVSGKYSIVKIRSAKLVYVLADVDVQFDNANYWTVTTSRPIYALTGPLFDFGFDYEEAERQRIAQEEEDRRNEEIRNNLAELILNLLDDHADKDEEYVVDGSKYGLSWVKIRGVFNFISICKILNSSNEEIDDSEFINMFAKSFTASQSNQNVVLVDPEYLWSVDVYGGEYDLIAVARDVIDYIENNKEGN